MKGEQLATRHHGECPTGKWRKTFQRGTGTGAIYIQVADAVHSHYRIAALVNVGNPHWRSLRECHKSLGWGSITMRNNSELQLTPGAKVGGPIFEGVDKDITLWADDQGRTSWLERFVDYLKAHGHLKDLAFMSFEHHPFMINGFTPPNDWATLYLEPGIMKHVPYMWRQDGVPAEVPLIISESGIVAGRSGPGYLGVTGRSIWECGNGRES